MGIKVRKGGVWVEVSSGGGSGGGGSSDPVGTIVAWAGSVATIPSEYQLCDGGAASTSALQAITGSNVPDLRDRFIVGANNISGTGTYPGVGVGSTGGSADAVVVSHNHSITQTDHSHTYTRVDPAGNTVDGSPNDANPFRSTSTQSTSSESANITIDDQGVSGTNANLPPYYALCYIIKHTATSGGGGDTDAGQGFFENDTTLNTSTTLSSNKNVGVFGPYTIGNNVTLTVPTGTTFTVV